MLGCVYVMEESKRTISAEAVGITEEEFYEFLSAKTHTEQMEILLQHSKKNDIIVEKKLKEKKKMGVKEFFKNAFGDMKENAQMQKEVSKAEMEAVKAESKARHEEAVAMGKPETRKAVLKMQHDEQIAAAQQRTAEANARIEKIDGEK